MEINLDTLKTLARFTEIGQPWPLGCKFFVPNGGDGNWYIANGGYCREADELSEIEANQLGFFFTKVDRLSSQQIQSLTERGLAQLHRYIFLY
jgi:hypothetical protein